MKAHKTGGLVTAAAAGALLALAFAAPVRAQSCPAGSINPLIPYDNQTPSPTIINGNNVYVGNSRLRLTHTAVNGATIDAADNQIDDSHITGEIGVRLGHTGNADSPTRYLLSTYEFRSPNFSQPLPVSGLTFRIHDLDAEDNITVNAYDQTGALIALTTSMYSFDPGGTIVSRVAGTNRFTSPSQNVNDRRGTVNFTFTGLQISRVELAYYDTSATGTYTVADLKGCNPTLTLYKTTQLAAGGPFGFSLTNASAASATITTTAADTPQQVDGNAGLAGLQAFGITTPNAAVDITETLPTTPAGWSLVAANTTCTNAAGTVIGTLNATTRVYSIPGGTTPAGQTFPGAQITCTYTNLPPRSEVQVTKSATPNPVPTGQVVSYSIVVRNNGPQAVSNVLLTDTAGVGQNCSVPSTTATCAATAGATCPASVPVATLLASGVTVPTLASGSQVTVTVQCTVTASGTP
jgi:uncharacterized repeat protein (TIGR01451 family)